MDSTLRKFYDSIMKHRKLVISVFVCVFIISMVIKPLVGVNYDIRDYLPENSPSTVALNTMKSEYDEGIPNARVMIEDVSIPEATDYKEKILAVDGVESVTWLDSYMNLAEPLDSVDRETVEEYYKDGNALFTITINESKRTEAVKEIEQIIGDNALTGDAASVAAATEGTIVEVRKIAIIAVILTLILLIFATRSWLEPLLVLAALGVAIGINGGTNLIFGDISFVTNAAGSILQLAVSLDYSVFLIHRFHECKRDIVDPKEAMVEALCKSTSSILSSGATTVIGFMALVLMRFQLGPDLGLALAKGVIISLITVFVFLPAIYTAIYNKVEKMQHRSFMPDFHGFGRFVSKVMIPMVCVFVIFVTPIFLASNSNDYYYGSSKIFDTDTKLGQDTEKIEETFGQSGTYALMVPNGNLATEKALSAELHKIPEVTRILSYVDTVGAEVPTHYLPEDTLGRLNSDDYTRMVISLAAEEEGAETFDIIEDIRDIAQRYYPDEFLLAGNGASSYDLMDTITADMLKVNLIAIAAVYLVLVLMMRSPFLPLLLVASIETAIWINLAIPYFSDSPVFYIAYLIISAVQLGATVDYAILFTNRYREHREKHQKKAAVIETVSSVTGSILVSGLALTIVGFLLGWISTHGIMAQLGIFLGRGGLCSMLMVFLVLPGLLYIFDRFYIRGGKTDELQTTNVDHSDNSVA